MSPGTLRRAVLHGPGDLRIEEAPLPAPGKGEVLLEVEGALTGGTTAKVVRRGGHARMGAPPLPLGHEGVGRVVAVGNGVARWNVGDRMLPANSASCGRCVRCEAGMSAQCRSMTWLTGLFATHALVPAPIVRCAAWPAPAQMDVAAAALTENLACVLKGIDRTPARPGERVLVVGTGPMACLWIHVLAAREADVTVLGRSAASVERAAAFGAAPASTDASGFDLVIECVGSEEAWRSALVAVRPGGRVNLFGGPPRDMPVPLDGARLHYDELTLTASFHHTPHHFEQALLTLAAGVIDVASLVTATVALDDLPAFFAQEERPLKALVTPSRDA